jgi:cellular nucleic acid-binding protein
MRYFQDVNPTLKCNHCANFGHFARDCPNERQKMNCNICGQDTHKSFECDQRMCFRCNKVGHKVYECKETNTSRCERCGNVGHSGDRCLKVWQKRDKTTRYTQVEKEFMRCVQCGESGHFKCTTV